MPCCCARSCETTDRRTRRTGLLGNLARIVVIYLLLIAGSGTLINTGNPVATEVGQIVQLVTFVEPTIDWAHDKGLEPVADGLSVLADGVPLPF